MKYPFKKNHSRILTIVMVFALLMTMLTGCMGGDDKTKETENQNPPKLNVNEVETTGPTETEPPETTEPVNENMATVKQELNVRSSPSNEANVISTLDVGTQVEILQTVESFGVKWGLVREGWIPMEFVEMNYIPDETEPSGETTPEGETTPDETEPEATTNNQNTANGEKGVITASELNIRSEASQNSDKKGMYTYGDRVTILETKNGWGRTDKGWISLNYVYIDGSTGTNTGKGIVTGTQLYVRSGPGINYESVGSVSKGDRVEILEQIKVGDMTWGCTKDGWISLSYVYIDGTTGEGSGTGTVTGDDLNIRSGPGTNYNSVGSLDKGDVVKILAQITVGDMTWGCIEQGWISMSYVDMD